MSKGKATIILLIVGLPKKMSLYITCKNSCLIHMTYLMHVIRSCCFYWLLLLLHKMLEKKHILQYHVINSKLEEVLYS